MKKQILFLLIIGILFSCNKDDDSLNLETEISGNWKLTQMTGSIPNSEMSDNEMEWQENYKLNTDGTFQKSRERNGVINEVSGTYNLIEHSNEILLELNFNNENEIVGSCTSNTKETMSLESKNVFFSTWNACDGPGLKYEKID